MNVEKPSSSARALPQRFGNYELLEEVGRGGAGVIHKARQPGLERLCAIKMLREEAGSAGASCDHLLAEARAAASLDHPNIVGIYEVGEVQGQLFFSMEFIEGENLASFVGTHTISAQKAAVYAEKIASAIAYAHSRGVTHCDLKPANVIIDQRDEPQITDFGLARRLGPDAPAGAGAASGAGSPNFMAPEQASARFGTIGVRTDVFGIGATLYYLLTDRPPFRGETFADTVDAVMHLEPVRPRSLRPGVPLDLETICLKCLEKRPVRRYRTAGEVAEELGRFLRDEPIHARRITQVERGWRFARRHPLLSGFALATLTLLLVIAVGSPVAVYRINQAREGADLQRFRAEANELRVRRQLYAANLQEAAQAAEAGDTRRTRELLVRHDPLASANRAGAESGVDLRGWEWRYLAALSKGDEESGLPASPFPVLDAAFLGDGRQLVTALADGSLQLHGVSQGSVPVRRLDGSGTTNHMVRLAVSRDQEQIAVSEFDLLTTHTILRVIERAGWRERFRFPVSGAVPNLAFSADGSHLVLAVMQQAGTRLETEIADFGMNGSGRIVRASLPSSQRFNVPVFSPDGSRYAVAHDDGTLSVRGVAGTEQAIRLRGHDFEPGWVQLVTHLEFSRDGRFLVSGGVDKTARVWEIRKGSPGPIFRGHSDAVLAATFSPDGRRVATSSRDRTLRIWDIQTGREIGLLRSHDSVAGGLAYSPDGTRLVSVGAAGEVRFWNVPSAVTRSAPTAEVPVGSLWAELLPDGLHWWSSTPAMEWTLHRLGDPNPVARIADTNLAGLRAKTFHPATRRLALFSRNGVLTVQDLSTGTRRSFNAGRTHAIATVRFSPDGRLLAVGLGGWHFVEPGTTNHLQVWDVDGGRILREFEGASEMPVFSPDNRWLASADNGGRVQLNDVVRGGSRLLGKHSSQVPGLAFSSDSGQLASGSTDGSIKLWSVASALELATLESQTSGTLSVAFGPEGNRLFAGSLDGVVQVWDLNSRLRLASLHGHRKGVTSLVFRDPDTLVTGGLDEIRAWHADPQLGQVREPVRR